MDYPELKNQLLRRVNDLSKIASPQAARVTSMEPDQEAEQRWAIVEQIDKIEKLLQSLPVENTPIAELLVFGLNAQVDAIAKNIEATEQKDNPAPTQRSTAEWIRYERAQTKARLQSVYTNASNAEKPNPSVAPNLAVAMLGRITAHQSIPIEKWAKGHRLNRSQVFAWKAVGGKPVKDEVSGDYARKIEAKIWLDADRLGLMRTDEDNKKN